MNTTLAQIQPGQQPGPFISKPYIEGTAIQRFATKHRLNTRIDVDDTKIIHGRDGHLYEHDSTTLGVMFMASSAKSAKMWGNRRRSGVAVGMTIIQDGDEEGALQFNPKNADQVKTAIAIAAIKRKRIMSDRQKESLSKARSQSPIGKSAVG